MSLSFSSPGEIDDVYWTKSALRRVSKWMPQSRRVAWHVTLAMFLGACDAQWQYPTEFLSKCAEQHRVIQQTILGVTSVVDGSSQGCTIFCKESLIKRVYASVEAVAISPSIENLAPSAGIYSFALEERGHPTAQSMKVG